MKAYIFLIHHDCSYVDGMAVIRAESYKRAEEILKSITWHEMQRPGEEVDGDGSYLDQKLVDNDGYVLDHYPEKPPKDFPSYANIWCCNARLDLKDPATEGIVATAYHDG
jgi:hypothetical protein